MKLYEVERTIREIRNAILFNLFSLFRREFIPDPRKSINIEVTGFCNLKCRFCAYQKKKTPKVRMSNDVFANCVEQAVQMGFTEFHLTPVTGDVFMDRHLFDKLDFLENHPKVESYAFFTNFTIPDRHAIRQLMGLNKLTRLTISVYGHDLDSFMAITQSNEKVYQRLIDHLQFLLDNLDRCACALEIGWRSYHKIPRGLHSEITGLLDQFKTRGIKVRKSQVYNNWGGYVTGEDVKGLDIDINSGASYKKGACAMLFNSIMAMADGTVNGCPCRDVDASLKIGDLHQQPLVEILSRRNQAYMQLIEEHQNGHYPLVCKNCDFYKSIYYYRSSSGEHGRPPLSLQMFKEVIARETSPTTGFSSGYDTRHAEQP
jgi:MoaA/NifB/PqqE/SkfB family radical SAM enzyme